MDNEKILFDHIQSVIKLMETRLVEHEKILFHAKKEYLEACDVIEQRNNLIKQIKSDEININTFIVKQKNSNSYSLDSRVREEDAKYWIEYDLELHEYYLTQEKIKLEEKELEYKNKRKYWLILKQKMEFIQNIYTKSKTKTKNIRLEKDAEELQEDQLFKSRDNNVKNIR